MDASQFIPRGLYSYLAEEAPSCSPHQAGYFRVMRFDESVEQVAEVICGMCPFVPKVALEAMRIWHGNNHTKILHRCVDTANAPAFRLASGTVRTQSIYTLRDEILKLPGFLEALAGGHIESVLSQMPGYVSPATYEMYRLERPWLSWHILAMEAGNLPLIRHLAKKGELFRGFYCYNSIDVSAFVWREMIKLGLSKGEVEEVYRRYKRLDLYQKIESEI